MVYPNRALFCVSSCAKPCSFLCFVVHQIVLFSAFRRAQNCALFCVSSAPNRALFCVSRCAKSRSFLCFVVRQIVLFSAYAKSCSFLRFVVHQIVRFSAFRRAPIIMPFPQKSIKNSFTKARDQSRKCRTTCMSHCVGRWV